MVRHCIVIAIIDSIAPHVPPRPRLTEAVANQGSKVIEAQLATSKLGLRPLKGSWKVA